MEIEQFNQKYHIFRPDINPNSLFASFKVFKKIYNCGVINKDQRPPYPILLNDPSFGDSFDNLNKSDVMVGLFVASLAIPFGYFATNKLNLLVQKFYVIKWVGRVYSALGLFMALMCSSYRLSGFMDNGLRWKHEDMIQQKYDFTREFESKTVWKHFRERND